MENFTVMKQKENREENEKNENSSTRLLMVMWLSWIDFFSCSTFFPVTFNVLQAHSHSTCQLISGHFAISKFDETTVCNEINFKESTINIQEYTTKRDPPLSFIYNIMLYDIQKNGSMETMENAYLIISFLGNPSEKEIFWKFHLYRELPDLKYLGYTS